jgi:hypothetical protein
LDGTKLRSDLGAKNLKRCPDSLDVSMHSGNSYQAALKNMASPDQQIWNWKGVINIVDRSNHQCGQA